MSDVEVISLVEASKQVLEVLEENRHLIEEHERPYYLALYDSRIHALRAAIAQAESRASEAAKKQEPVAIDPLPRACNLAGLDYQTYLKIKAYMPATPPAAPVQEPVKPYAYEYGRDNGDGTYSVVIDKGSLVQTQPAVYNYVRPQNAHKDWPIKELFDRPPAAQPAYIKEDLDRAFSAGMVEGEKLAIEEAAAQRQWVGLTDEEVQEIETATWGAAFLRPQSARSHYRAIEAKLRSVNGFSCSATEKNGG